MIYEMVLNSQMGPYQFSVRHFANGTVELWLPRMATPIIIKDNGVIISVNVPGPPVPVAFEAQWLERPVESR